MNLLSTKHAGKHQAENSRLFKSLIWWFTCFATVILASVQGNAQIPWYQDLDGDGFGNPSVSQVAASKPSGYVQNNLDCKDNVINGALWGNIGMGLSSGSINYSAAVVDSSGTVYVAFSDVGNSNKITVLQYSGTGWDTVGSPGFSAGQANHISLALDGSGNPYVAYTDLGNSSKATVMKYNGSNWAAVGSAGFSPSTVSSTEIAFDANDTLYIVYVDGANLNKPTVQKYNGTNWVTVGTAGFTSTGVWATDITIDTGGKPCVVFYQTFDGGFNTIYHVYAWRYNGTSWASTGLDINAPVNSIDIVSGADGSLYAMGLRTNAGSAYVYKYNGGVSWSALGTITTGNGFFGTGNIAVDAAGGIYIALSDEALKVKKYNGSAWADIAPGIGSSVSRQFLTVGSNGRLYVVYQSLESSNKAAVAMLQRAPVNAATPTLAATKTTISCNEGISLSVSAGNLNDAAKWKWYTGSCGGTLIDSGSSIMVSPLVTTTYHARGEGECASANGSCGSVTITVNPRTWYADADNDGWGNNAVVSLSCIKPTGYVQNNLDCNDNDSNAISWAYKGNAGFSVGAVQYPNIIADHNGTTYVAFRDNNNSNKATVMKNSGSGWTVLGSAGFSSDPVSDLMITLDTAGVPYIVYRNQTTGSIIVMKYDGSSWVNVGSTVATFGGSPDLAIDKNNTPYVVYAAGFATVKKFDGSNWVAVGNTGGLPSVLNKTRIAIDGNGTPYIVFDDINTFQLSAFKYNGSNWVAVGTGFGAFASGIEALRLILDDSGTPYVLHVPYGNTYSVDVYKYNGSSWVTVGSSFITNGSADMAVDANGTLYLVYEDVVNPIVKKYTGSSWVTVGSNTIARQGIGVSSPTICLDNKGIPNIAFTEYINSSYKLSTMAIQPTVTNATTPKVAGNTNIVCGSGTVLSIDTGSLNDAGQWKWYTASCGGVLIDSGASISVSPTVTTTYYVRGEDGCSNAPGNCGNITITVTNRTWYADADGDGWGSAGDTTVACTPPSGYAANNLDCDDNNVNAAVWGYNGPAAFSAGTATLSKIATDVTGNIYVAYKDDANGGKVTVMKKTGNSWSAVGNAGFTSGVALEMELGVDKSGTVYIAYKDSASYDLTVMKYNGTGWINAGATFPAVFSPFDLAIAPDNTPYLAFDSSGIYLRKYNGSNWVIAGSPLTNNGIFISLAFDANNNPYLAASSTSFTELAVSKYNGSSWVQLGSVFYANTFYFEMADLAIGANDTPYLFSDNGSGGFKISKYTGSSWAAVGSAFNSSTYNYKLIISQTGAPYIAYIDGSGNAAVKKYSGSSWVDVASGLNIPNNTGALSMTIDNAGIPHVVYGESSPNYGKVSVVSAQYPTLGNATTPAIAGNTNPSCGDSVTLSIDTGSLNDAGQWKWYTGTCGGTLIDSGTSIKVAPSANTTYYARGEGGCATAPGTCGSITVTVNIPTWYADVDSDGLGDATVSQVTCARPTGYVRNNLDCNDTSANNRLDWRVADTAGFSTGAAAHIKIASHGSSTYVVYQDAASGNKATVMKYNGTGWTTLGTAGFSAGTVAYTDIAVDGSGTPYVVYKDGANGDKATVMKYDGSNWVLVGSAGFSAGGVDFTAMDIDAGGTPYVVYKDAGNGSGVTVMKYNGTAWVSVGSANIVGNSVSYTDITLKGGIPYIAFHDDFTTHPTIPERGVSIMKFTGGSWAFVGGRQSIVLYSGEDIKIDIDNNGTPFVKYIYYTGSSKAAQVAKFNGSSWVTVGAGNFGSNNSNLLSGAGMALDASGTPYIVYNSKESYGNTYNHAIVQKADGSNWDTVGSIHFSAGEISYPDMIFDDNDMPWVAYRDLANSDKVTVMTLKQPELGNPTLPKIAGKVSIYCGSSTVLSIDTGSLNDATEWKWYSGSCGGTLEGTGKFITVSPAVTTTYYVRGEGGCASPSGSCGSHTITVGPRMWYADVDGDGWGDTNIDTAVCDGVIVQGYVPNNLDCKDTVSDGTAWKNISNTPFSNSGVYSTAMASAPNGTTYVGYYNGSNGSVAKFDGTGWTNPGNGQFEAYFGIFNIAIDQTGNPYVIHAEYDLDNGTGILKVKKYAGSNWVQLGGDIALTRSADMAMGSGSIPYVVYRDNGKATVKKYDGSNWLTVGNARFGTNVTGNLRIAVDAQGTPYITYYSSSPAGMYVMKYDDTGWANVGGVVATVPSSLDIAVDATGIPYVLYVDASNDNKSTVAKYNGTGWVTVGGSAVSAGIVTFHDIVINSNGTPYIVYTDGGNNDNAVVRKFNGTAWDTVGSPATASGSSSCSITLDSTETPVIALVDYAAGNKALIKTIGRASGGNPVIDTLTTTATTICAGSSTTISLTGTLNDAEEWHWYSGGCAGTALGTGTSLQVTPTTTITYYVRGEGGCVSSPVNCDSITINVIDSTNWYADADGDGWGNPAVDSSLCGSAVVPGYVRNNFDCNDSHVNATQWLNDGAGGFSAGLAFNTDIAIAKNGTRFVAYRDGTQGDKASVMKNDGSGWTPVGAPGFTANAVKEVSIALDNNNMPLLACLYTDNSIGVMKYDGNQWVTLGSPLAASSGASPDIIVDRNNTVYVAYAASNIAYAKKYDGSNWITVGTGPIAGGYNTKIATDNAGSLYVVYFTGNSYYVAKYNGTAWANMGSGFGTFFYGSPFSSLAVDAGGTPYVMYGTTGFMENTMTVVKFNAGSWSALGGNYITQNTTSGNISIDAAGTPYIVYKDDNSGGAAVTFKYNGSNWVPVGGSAIVSGGAIEYPAIAIDNVGIPHIAFRDFSNAGKLSVISPQLPVLGEPTTPKLTGSTNIYCGDSTTLSIDTGSLNDATQWKWYKSTCGGTLIDSGTSIKVIPSVTTTYYARGEGGCASSAGACGSITVTVSPLKWYADADGDGWGDLAGDSSVCAGVVLPGYVLNNFDCNDNNVNTASWNNVGAANFSAGVAELTEIATAADGTVYVAYRDGANSNKATVMKKDGNNWTEVGVAGFTPGSVAELKIAIDKNGVPHIAYKDNAGSDIIVMKYTGSGWVNVGAAVATFGSSIKLAIAPDNTPYVVYEAGNIYVKKYNGSNWASVGSPLSAGKELNALAIGTNNKLYLAYCPYYYELQVVTFDGNNWVNVGMAFSADYDIPVADLAVDGNNMPYLIIAPDWREFSVYKYTGTGWSGPIDTTFISTTTMCRFAVSKSGTPYIAYKDYFGNASVKKFSGNDWVSVGGSVAVSPGNVSSMALNIDNNDIPQVVFGDAVNGNKISVVSPQIQRLGNPTTPVVGGPERVYCGNPITLSVNTGSLNDAAKWKWYTGSCGGTLIDSGASITVTPTADITNYHVRAEGGCITTPVSCGSKAVTIRKFTWYADADNDGWGTAGTDSVSCNQPTGYVLNNIDCSSGNVNDTSWVYDGTAGISAGSADYTSLVIAPNGTKYIAYRDNNAGNKPTVMKNTENGWELVGTAGFGPGAAAPGMTLAVDKNNVPYVAFVRNGSHNLNTIVMKHDGSNWISLGSLTNEYQDNAIFGIASDNTPYVVERDNYSNLKKYNGSTWVNLGTLGSRVMDMAFDGSGAVYVSLEENDNIVVKKYDGNSITGVGGVINGLFGAYYTAYARLDVDSTGMPYIFYATSASNYGIIKKYNGSAWVAVANTTPEPVTTGYADIAIDQFGMPIIAYTGAGERAVVRRHIAGGWHPYGNSALISQSQAHGISIALDRNDLPHIAFRDGSKSNKAAVMTIKPGGVAPTTPVLATSDTILCGGTTATLSIRSGNLNAAEDWHWYTGSCGDTLVGTGNSIQVTPLSTTTYYARGEGSCLSSHGVCDSIVIKSFANPVVTVDPQDSTVCNNTNASFDITASGDNSLTYQWQVDMGAGYINLADTGVYSGATTNKLMLTGPNTTMTGNLYRCVVTNGCQTKDTSAAATFTVYPIPTVNTTSDKVVCNGTATSVNFNGAVNGTTYGWTNNVTSIGLAASGTGNIASFNATNTGNTPVAATVIVTPTANGCVGIKDTFLITVNPTPNVTATNDQILCNTATTLPVNFTGAVSGTTYGWINSNTSIGLAGSGMGNISAFAASNTTNAPVMSAIIVTPTANGCTGAKDTFTIKVNPTPNVVAVNDQVLCNTAATTAVNFSGAVSGTTYSWANNTTSIGLAASGTGNIASFMATNTGNTPVTARIIVTPTANGCVGANDTFTITVNPTPNVATTNDQVLCNTASTTPVNFTGAVSGTTYSWTNTTTSIGLGTSGSGNIASFVASNTTSAPIMSTLIVTPSANGCTGPKDTFTIKVNPTPNVVTTNDQVLCNTAATTAVNFSGAVSGTTYSWANNTTSIGLAASGTGNIASFMATNTGNTPVTARIIVTPTANGCVGANDTFTITVNPTPGVATTNDQVLCNTASTTPVSFTGAVSGTTYSWTNSTTSIGLGASGNGNIASFVAGNTASIPVTATIIVTPSASGCTGPKDTFTIKVNPTPNVVTTNDQVLCNTAATTAVNFSGTVSGTTYSWTNSTTSIGLAANGTGNIASFATTNNTNAPVVSTVIVTPSANGCVGTGDTFTVKVNPTPSITANADQVVCNGSSASASFTGTVVGTTYDWTNNLTSIGLSGTGSGNIPAYMATNTSSTPATARIIVTPWANGCVGVPDTFNTTVNPTPDITSLSNVAVCNGANTSVVNFNGAVTGTTYGWTNSTPSIGLSASGTGNIPSFTGTNSTNAPVTATITITPSANGCTGLTDVFSLTVNPTPTANTVANMVLCNGANTSLVNLNGAVSGTTYNWTNNDASIGLSANGTGNIASFKGKNSTSAPVTATITVTPVANGCMGSDMTFGITVNPTPDLPVVSDVTVCNGLPTTPVNFAGAVSGTVYSWTNNTTSIGLAASGNGNIASFAAINNGIAPITTTIKVTTMANNCSGESRSFDITVNPTPKLSTTLNPKPVCAYTEFDYAPKSQTASTSFIWTRAAVTGITPATATGSGNIAETLSSNLLTKTDVRYVYTLSANGCSNDDTVTLQIDPVPALPTIATKTLTDVCANTMFQNFGAATPPPPGVEYRWTATNAEVWAGGKDKMYSLINFTGQGKATVKLSAYIAGYTCTASDSFEVTVSNNKSGMPNVVYYNGHFICLDNSMDSYQWGYDDASSLDSVVLLGEQNQDYQNPNPDFANRYYWVATKDGECAQKAYFNAPTSVYGTINKADISVKVYPNPATEYADIEVKGLPTGKLNVELTDIAGKSIRSIELTNSKARIHVGDLPSGVYTVLCYHNQIRIAVSKLVKNQ